jgi:hypothetical protein
VTRLSPQEHRLRSILERDWQATVVDLAKRRGWRWYAPPKAGVRANGSVRLVPAGFPDLTLCRGDRLVFAELKRETGKTTPAQDEWLAALAAVPGASCFVWRPSDLDHVRTVLGDAA